jgi:general stress protein YciG
LFHAFFLKEIVPMTSKTQAGKQDMKPGASSGIKSERGFAAMDPERQRAIAKEGGKAAHKSGHAHEFTSEEAREAGRKGGQASSKSKSSKS